MSQSWPLVATVTGRLLRQVERLAERLAGRRRIVLNRIASRPSNDKAFPGHRNLGRYTA